jgi:membrane protease YdiL (CAAX protease family)
MRFLKSEAGAVVLWLAGTIALAAAIVPWVYRIGKNLAISAASNDLSAFQEWLGAASGRAEFERFFSRSMVTAALLLLPLLLMRLKAIRRENPGRILAKTPPLPWKTRLFHLITAFILAAGLLWLLGTALEAAGAYTSRADLPKLSKFFNKTFYPSLGAAVIEEWLFRGMLLGVWLRIAKPGAALLGTSFVFAFVHFMQPPPGTEIANPAAATAGFQLLGLILKNFSNPQFIAAEFLVLFSIGLILGATRLRTGALWFPIGLHAGWIFAFKGFNLLHKSVDANPLHPLWIGDSLKSGLLPLVTLLITAVICHFLLRCVKSPEKPLH